MLKKFVVFMFRDIMDLTTGVRTSTLTSLGIFELVVVMFIYNVFFVVRNVYVDEYLLDEVL